MLIVNQNDKISDKIDNQHFLFYTVSCQTVENSMSLSYKFNLREILNLSKGALYLRVTYKRKNIVKSLRVILPVEHYDEHRQIVLANTPEAIKPMLQSMSTCKCLIYINY